jgi:hypothetical protein
MDNQFNFKILGTGSHNQGRPEFMKEKAVPYPFRFLTKEKYLYISRIAYFQRKSINETLDDLIFGPRWMQKNEEYKAQQKKLGVTDAEIQSRRKKRIRRWNLKKAA